MVKKSVNNKKTSGGIDVYNWLGEKIATRQLPKSILNEKASQKLLAQIVRVYQFNMRTGNAATKTRGGVAGGGKKVWRQKETGRARQGSIRAPHWRGGGVVFGPQKKDYSLKISQKMRQKSLRSVLAEKARAKTIKVITGVDGKIPTKTKEVQHMLNMIYKFEGKKPKILFMITKTEGNNVKTVRNLPYMTVRNVESLNTLDVLHNDEILFTENAFLYYEK